MSLKSTSKNWALAKIIWLLLKKAYASKSDIKFVEMWSNVIDCHLNKLIMTYVTGWSRALIWASVELTSRGSTQGDDITNVTTTLL